MILNSIQVSKLVLLTQEKKKKENEMLVCGNEKVATSQMRMKSWMLYTRKKGASPNLLGRASDACSAALAILMLSSLNRLQWDTLILSGSVPGCLIQSAQTRQPHYTCLSDSKKASSDRRLQNRDQSKETRRDDGCERNKQLS